MGPSVGRRSAYVVFSETAEGSKGGPIPVHVVVPGDKDKTLRTTGLEETDGVGSPRPRPPVDTGHS